MRVAIVTGSRADWNGLGMVAKCLRDEHKVVVKVVAIGQHYEFPDSLSVIIDDGFDPVLYRTNVQEDMALGCGTATIALGSLLASDPVDMVLVLGDRFEIAGTALATSLRGIPLAHIGGGDITEGSIDNRLRYAITALAELHFVTNNESALRITHGEVCNVGNPALDRIAMTPIVNREILFERLGLKENKRNILVAFHAVTAEANPLAGCAEMLNALAELPDTSLLLLGTNSDNGSREITEWFKLYIATHDSRWMFRENLPPEDFYGCLQHFDCMIGNSSAGLIETARFGIPVVNIGCRQKGRSTPANVFNCAPTSISIKGTLEVVLAGRCPPAINPYGDGHSAPRIAKIMVEHLVRGDLTS